MQVKGAPQRSDGGSPAEREPKLNQFASDCELCWRCCERVRMFKDRSTWQTRLTARQFSDGRLVRDEPGCFALPAMGVALNPQR